MTSPFRGRCATCRFWEGDKEKVARQYDECGDKNKFIIISSTHAAAGNCKELRIELYLISGDYQRTTETPGVFGCILYEPDK